MATAGGAPSRLDERVVAMRRVETLVRGAELKLQDVHLVADLHRTAWSTRELVVRDNVGHTLYFGQPFDGDR